jgi:hypothetical protein
MFMATNLIQPWSEIRRKYADLAHLKPAFDSMLTLIKEIESSNYATGLFAWTSMSDLCIVQAPVTYPYNGPYLRISPCANGQLEFRYLDTAIKDRQWHRTVNGDEGFTRLERFVDQLHWFG